MKLLDVCAFGLTGSMIPYSFFLFHESGLTSLTNVHLSTILNKKSHPSLRMRLNPSYIVKLTPKIIIPAVTNATTIEIGSNTYTLIRQLLEYTSSKDTGKRKQPLSFFKVHV